MTLARLNNLTASMRTSKLDAVILNPGPTLTYLTGVHFHLMERPVVLFVAPGTVNRRHLLGLGADQLVLLVVERVFLGNYRHFVAIANQVGA